MEDILNFGRITVLAVSDSINPCAIAVLTMILLSILIANPKKKKRVLYAGLSFVAAIYIGYLIYGIVIIQFFKAFAEFVDKSAGFLYKGLAILAMIIGALNIKDFFIYKPGGFATEMPLFLRPKVKKIISKITSPSGAFVIGFLITLFLLPCTIGPYIIASGILSNLNFLKSTFWLIYYNLIFVLPMLIITLIIYFGFTRIEKVSGWKEKNIKILHLIAGILIFGIGISLLLGFL